MGEEVAGAEEAAGGTGTVAAGGTGTVAAGAAEGPCIDTWCGPYHRALDLTYRSIGMVGGRGELRLSSVRFRLRPVRLLLRQLPMAASQHPPEESQKSLACNNFCPCGACSTIPMQPSLPVVAMQPYAGHQMQHLGCLAQLVRLQALATYIDSMH